jgi:hypothetical protein
VSPVCRGAPPHDTECRNMLPNEAAPEQPLPNHAAARATKRNINLIRANPIGSVSCSPAHGVTFLPEILSDRRVQIAARPSGRTPLLVRMVAAALCMQMLADCARRPIAPDEAARAPIKSTAISQSGGAQRQSRSGHDCPFKLSGLGDTWLDGDEAAPRNCPANGRLAGAPRSPCARACAGPGSAASIH